MDCIAYVMTRYSAIGQGLDHPAALYVGRTREVADVQ